MKVNRFYLSLSISDLFSFVHAFYLALVRHTVLSREIAVCVSIAIGLAHLLENSWQFLTHDDFISVEKFSMHIIIIIN